MASVGGFSQAIQTVAGGAWDFWTGGVRGVAGALEKGKNFSTALKDGFHAKAGDWDAITIGKELDENGNVVKPGYRLSGRKVLGAASGLGVGYRFLSGGGIYRDKDGNTDLAGIPFV